jgi:DNA-binding FrmR family transcriptional regulator
MKKKVSFADHSPDVKRINRLIGQLEGVQKMINDNKYCVDILNQTRAISSALRGLEASILERHVQHCLKSASKNNNSKELDGQIEELMEIFRKRMK